MEILLNDIMNLNERDLNELCIDLNISVNNIEPLDIMLNNYQDVLKWFAHKSKRNTLSRKYVLSFVRLYTEGSQYWLFGGYFRVEKKENFDLIQKGVAYDLFPVKFENLIGRLVIEFKNNGLSMTRKAENVINDMKVYKILDKRYDSIPFPGLDNINVSFKQLETIIKSNNDNWKNKLENISAVYLLIDRRNGRKYVGATYGYAGVWQRWSNYIYTVNGGNKALTRLRCEDIQNNFSFSLLEWHCVDVDKEFLVKRENHWKDVLLSRAFGYNEN